MNVLWLSPYAVHPPRHGTASRIAHLAAALQRHHRVTVLSFEGDWEMNENTADAPFEVRSARWTALPASRLRYWTSRVGVLPARSPASAANLAELRELLDRRSIDVVIAENVQLAPLLPAIADRPLVWAEEGIFSALQHPSLQPPTNLYRRAQQTVTCPP